MTWREDVGSYLRASSSTWKANIATLCKNTAIARVGDKAVGLVQGFKDI